MYEGATHLHQYILNVATGLRRLMFPSPGLPEICCTLVEEDEHVQLTEPGAATVPTQLPAHVHFWFGLNCSHHASQRLQQRAVDSHPNIETFDIGKQRTGGRHKVLDSGARLTAPNLDIHRERTPRSKYSSSVYSISDLHTNQ